jgi:hypothetical protein
MGSAIGEDVTSETSPSARVRTEVESMLVVVKREMRQMLWFFGWKRGMRQMRWFYR